MTQLVIRGESRKRASLGRLLFNRGKHRVRESLLTVDSFEPFTMLLSAWLAESGGPLHFNSVCIDACVWFKRELFRVVQTTCCMLK